MNGQALVEFLIFLAVLVPLVLLWVYCFINVMRRKDLSGVAKVAWLVVIVVFPYFGAILYLVLRSTAVGWKQMEASADEAAEPQGPNAGGNGRA
jgi:TRAP-type mannitol/chloroaromatic compound transport system permease small subunit